MHTFNINPLGAAIIFTILAMGLIGLLFVLPVACIQWTWNQIVPSVSVLPPINVWQSVLLYLAACTMLFLSGIIKIEFDQEAPE